MKFVLEAISTSCAHGLWRGGGWGKHISLAAIFEGKHISLVICVRGNTYHGGTHITAGFRIPDSGFRIRNFPPYCSPIILWNLKQHGGNLAPQGRNFSILFLARLDSFQSQLLKFVRVIVRKQAISCKFKSRNRSSGQHGRMFGSFV